jgi:hypothetical protein
MATGMSVETLSNGDVVVAMSPENFVKIFGLDPLKYKWAETAEVYSFGRDKNTRKYGYPYQQIVFSKK